MTLHSESRIVDAPPDDVFRLAADVERYPEYVPLWRDARIIAHNSKSYVTEQVVGIGRILERFRTRTVLHRPDYIEITSDDGLFHDFYIRWDFAPVGRGCRVTLALNWTMRSATLQRAVDQLLPSVTRTIAGAFERRVREVLTAGAQSTPQ